MNYCPFCQSLEGDTREGEDGQTYCAECDSDEPIQRIREHDDYDLER